MVEPTDSTTALEGAESPSTKTGRPKKGGGRRIAMWIAGSLVAVLAILGIAAQVAIDRAEPVLRSRVVDTVSTRYDARVQLDRFHVSVIRGFEAEGEGLRLYPQRFQTDQPLVSIARFAFRVPWIGLLRVPMHVGEVTIDGMVVDIPPKEQRGRSQPAPVPANSVTAAPQKKGKSGIKIVVDEVLIRNMRLLVRNGKPGKLPLDFEIGQVRLNSVGPGQPMRFVATLVNPKPIGDIQSTGYFGPFQQEDPGLSPVSGSYTFTHADLATFKGIGGILSSTGRYAGTLNEIDINGQADVPDFRLNTGNHPMPLRTVFHALVDGTSGDTYLKRVQAQLGRSAFLVSGSVVKVPGDQDTVHGHNITLDVSMDRARIEDFLNLAVKTSPPVMSGSLRMKARIFLPPGEATVPDRLHLSGNFEVSNAFFSGAKIQEKVDLLSRLGQGHPKDPDLHVNPPQPEPHAPALVKGDFTLAGGSMAFDNLSFGVTGANIDMTGVYTLDGSKFDFHGHAKLNAHPSQMTTGWKSAMLKLADPFFAKQGYGTVIPIEVHGTKSDPHFGLDFGHKDASEKPRPKPH